MGPGLLPIVQQAQYNQLQTEENKMKQFKINYHLLIVFAGFFFLMLTTLPVTAQENQLQGPPAEQEISHSDLDNAAKAYTSMQVIHEEFQQSVQQTQDQEERQQLQNQANQKLVHAIERSGLDVETYNHIMARVQSDPQLRETFIEKIQTIQ
jgi:hypothetical protein